jgi:hypothetical protein
MMAASPPLTPGTLPRSGRAPPGGPMPLADRSPSLTGTKPNRNHRTTATAEPGPGPVPCHWRNAGPMLLADDTASTEAQLLSTEVRVS